MNERIRELAEQAGFSSWELNPSVETMSDTPEKVNKLAELIVRECVNVNYNSAFKDGEFCARELLEHFGIEE